MTFYNKHTNTWSDIDPRIDVLKELVKQFPGVEITECSDGIIEVKTEVTAEDKADLDLKLVK